MARGGPPKGTKDQKDRCPRFSAASTAVSCGRRPGCVPAEKIITLKYGPRGRRNTPMKTLTLVDVKGGGCDGASARRERLLECFC